jgi:uncharacterized membrane protein YeaQ/YmgE (transglycosylase-associated protein family)
MESRGWLLTIIIGLVAGVLAKLIMPGKDPGGILVTILIGIVGSFIGTFIGSRLWGGEGYQSGLIMSIVGALILLGIWRLISGRRTVV